MPTFAFVTRTGLRSDSFLVGCLLALSLAACQREAQPNPMLRADAGVDGEVDSGAESSDCGALPAGTMQTRQRYARAVAPYGGACASEMQTRTCRQQKWSEWSGSYEATVCAVAASTSCDRVPDGGSDSRVRYEQAHVAAGAACVSEVQSRTCRQGVWSEWSGHYEASVCTAAPARSCDGVAHEGSDSRVRYALAEVAHGSTCTSEVQTRTCDDGTWTDWSGNYAAVSCVARAPQSCDGVPHGGQVSRVRYANANVAFGGRCDPQVQTRTCDDGAWSTWTGSYGAETCTVVGAASCDGVPHGGKDSRVFYQQAQVPYGSTCTSEVQTRSCSDGTWSPWQGSYAAASCTVAAAATCDGVPHGGQASRQRYATSQVAYGSSCTSEVQARTCDNGSWSVWSGSYEATLCAVSGAASCDGVPHGGKDSRVRYAASQVGHDQSCESEVQSRTCDDGTWSAWSGSFAANACSVGKPAACDDIAHGTEQTRVRYAASESHNTVCASELQRRVCQDGVFTAWSGSLTIEACHVCIDADDDGHGKDCAIGADCDDAEPSAFVGASEVEWNFIDENCDGKIGRHLELAHRFEHFDVWSEGDIHVKGDYVVAYGGLYGQMEVRKLGALGTRVARYALPESALSAYSYAFGGDVLVVSSRSDSSVLNVHDFSDVTKPPVLRAALRVPGPPVESRFTLSADGQRLYVRGVETLVYDLSDAAAPALLGTLTPVGCEDADFGYRAGLELLDDGHSLLVICNSGYYDRALVATDLSKLPAVTWSFLQYGDYISIDAALSSRGWWVDGTLYQLDLTDPAAPQALARSGNYAREDGVRLLDDALLYRAAGTRTDRYRLCLDPFGDAQARCSPELPQAGGVLLATEASAVIGGVSHLVEYDLSKVEEPVLSGTWLSLPRRSYVASARAYIEGGVGYMPTSDGFAALDLKTFAEPPATVGHHAGTGGFTVHQGYVYGVQSNTYSTPTVIDARDITQPENLGSPTFGWGDGALAVTRTAGTFLVSTYRSSVSWFSVANPTAPVYVGSADFDPITNLGAMVDDGQYLYVRDSVGGNSQGIRVFAFDGSSLTQLRRLGPGAGAMTPRDGNLAWCEGYSRLRITDPSTGVDQRATDVSCSQLWNAGESLFIAESFELTDWDPLHVFDDATGALSTVALPASVPVCSVVGAGESVLLCDASAGLFVLRITTD